MSVHARRIHAAAAAQCRVAAAGKRGTHLGCAGDVEASGARGVLLAVVDGAHAGHQGCEDQGAVHRDGRLCVRVCVCALGCAGGDRGNGLLPVRWPAPQLCDKSAHRTLQHHEHAATQTQGKKLLDYRVSAKTALCHRNSICSLISPQPLLTTAPPRNKHAALRSEPAQLNNTENDAAASCRKLSAQPSGARIGVALQ